MGATMNSLDNIILCCGKSWDGDCQICEEQAYKDYKQEMQDDWETGRNDSYEDEDNDD